VKFKALL